MKLFCVFMEYPLLFFLCFGNTIHIGLIVALTYFEECVDDLADLGVMDVLVQCMEQHEENHEILQNVQGDFFHIHNNFLLVNYAYIYADFLLRNYMIIFNHSFFFILVS